MRVPGSRSVGSCGCCRHHATPAREAADLARPRGAAIVPTGPFFRVTTGRPGTKHAARGIRTWHPAPSTRHPAPGTRHPAPGTRHPAPGTGPAGPGRQPRATARRFPGRPSPTAPRHRFCRSSIRRDPGALTAPLAQSPRHGHSKRQHRPAATPGRRPAPPLGPRIARTGRGGVRRTDHRTPARPRLPVARPLIGRHAPARQHAGATPRIGDTTALCQLRVGRPGPPRVTETGLPTTLTRARFQHA